MIDAPYLRVLGSIALGSEALQGGRVTTLLAILAANRGTVVSVDRLVNELWPDDPPESSVASLHVYVSRLRSRLTGTPLDLITRHPGYLLEAAESDVDAPLFEHLVAEAEAAASSEDWDDALGLALDAQSLWRGTPFTGAASSAELDAATERLEALRLRVDEVQVSSLIRLGRAAEAEAASGDLLSRDRLNERRWQLRMRAQHAAGNTTLALATFEQFRALLRDELGVDPSASSRELHALLLRADAAPPPERSRPQTVGRSEELSALRRAVDASVERSGRVVVLYGEAGIGKTVLTDAAAALAEERGVRTVSARGVDGPGTPALWMWEEVLGALRGTPGAIAIRDLVEALPSGTEHSEEGRFRLAHAIARTVIAGAEEGPLLVILDDVQ